MKLENCHSRKFRIRQQAEEKFVWNPLLRYAFIETINVMVKWQC